MLDSDAWRLGYFNPDDAAEYVLMRSNEERFREFQKEHRDYLYDHFYITIVPKTLHMLEGCLAFIPRNLHLFLILNGLNRWEKQFLNRVYPSIPKFELETNNRPFLYDRVLDLLMECNKSNFGVLDPDCFVLGNEIFSNLQIKDSEFALSPFTSLNKRSNITFPRTFFLFFNTSVIRHLRKQFQISFKRCWLLPSRLEPHLTDLNLGYHNFPHDTLNYLDNFQLIWAIGLHRGLSFGVRPQGKITHVGAGNNYLTDAWRDQIINNLPQYKNLPRLEQEKLGAALFAYYAHLLLLEDTKSVELKEHYLQFFLPFGSSGTLLKTISNVVSPYKVKDLDLVIARLKIFRGEEPHASKLARIKRKMDASPFRYARDLPASFDPMRYVLGYLDLIEHEVDPYEHFLNWGRHEGRVWH